MDTRAIPFRRPLLRRLCLPLAALLLAGLAAAAVRTDDAPAGPLPVGAERPVELPGLHNVLRFSEKLYNGSVPEGEEGFRSLQRLGIRTIVTVDGYPPELELARRHGMRYVHLPFGYDGCPAPRAAAIVRAVRDLPGPIYLHCHHGKNRSPVAAAFARIALDGISNEEAVRELERAGTGKNYTGLYENVRSYRPPSPEELDAVPPEFPEVAETPPLMTAMVEMDRRFQRLLRAQRDGWPPPRARPAAELAHEALLLREEFAEWNRTPEARRKPADFRRWMRASERDAAALEAALRAAPTGVRGDGRRDEASRALGRVAAACGSCHAKYRNVPQ
jgi:protein tyrosine phosphatase (PTP) superfamily phosphohydrolase (DUF442 family)/cytochrome c553